MIDLHPTTPFDPTYRFATSWFLPPSWLYFLRALLSLYAFVTLFFILGWDGTHGNPGEAGRNFSYFTTLTYWGLAFYNAFAALHTGTYWLTGRPLLSRWPRALQVAHSCFYTTIVVFPFLVTIVYWALLFDGFDNAFSTWSNVSQHALNAVYALIEIIVPRTQPLPWLEVVVVVVVLALYLGLAYVTFAAQHFYVYDFLDDRKHSRGVVAGYILGILAGGIVIFIIVRYIIFFRQWLTETKLGKTGVRSPHHKEVDGTGAPVALKEDAEMQAINGGEAQNEKTT